MSKLFLKRNHLIFSLNRYISTKYEGLKELIDENQARICFDKWIQSLWFAPGNWTQQTKYEKNISIEKCYIPFWNYSIQGSIQSSVRLSQVTHTRYKNTIVPHRQWYSISLQFNDLHLNDINIYAAQSLDRYYLNQLNISFNNHKLVQLNQQSIQQWTVDKDTAFRIGWDLNLIQQIKSIIRQKANQMYPQYSDNDVDSFHMNIHSKNSRLLYYPIYVLKYKYDSDEDFTCLIDGINGQVTGDRQYSMIKVTLTSFIGFYPALYIALSTLGSFVDPSLAIQLASLLTFQTVLPFALLFSPLIGYLAKNYPKFYKEKMKEQQWESYQSNSSQFTYDFTSSFHQQYHSFKQQQQQQQSKQTKTKRPTEDKPFDLYELLSVDRNANEKQIKKGYLLKAKELHPDRNPGNKNAEELFKKVNQAYAILSDPYKRKQYDQFGFDSVKYN